MGDLKHGSVELDTNNLVIIPNVLNRTREWVFRLGSLEISAQSEDEMKEWIHRIQEAIQLNKTKVIIIILVSICKTMKMNVCFV